eukprot:3474031-Prymnesium_polylepis.1
MGTIVARHATEFNPEHHPCVVAQPQKLPHAAHYRAFGFGPPQQGLVVAGVGVGGAVVAAHSKGGTLPTALAYLQACCFKQAAEMAAAAELHCERCSQPQPTEAPAATGSSAAGLSVPSQVQERAEQLFNAMRSEATTLKMVEADGFPSFAETDASKDLQVEAGKGRGQQHMPMYPLPAHQHC